MTQSNDDTSSSQTRRLRSWLKSDVTVTLPGWAYALGGVVALVLLLTALD
jgi:hypothetical protein